MNVRPVRYQKNCKRHLTRQIGNRPERCRQVDFLIIMAYQNRLDWAVVNHAGKIIMIHTRHLAIIMPAGDIGLE